ncbi:CMP-N-acetylneuraminic acid synthetase [Gammaproteobacteria bacterium]|jgi:CMP-N,N'-diacetyllegionaminic acid synthase|nr:CMP-N-acetylneuraminic acid synthetase [Gammaproteobacteria bacterium]
MGSNVALITGRGGSSFANKNIRPIKGIPALGYPAIAVNESENFDYKFCSSDCSAILDCASEYGFDPILRPDELAQAQSLHIDTIDHALKMIFARGIVVDHLFVFLANNVCTTSLMITDAMKLLHSRPTATSVVPVYREYDQHPLRAMKTDIAGDLIPFVESNKDEIISSNRQDLTPSYFLCHNFWALSIKNQSTGWSGAFPWPFLGDYILPIECGALTDIHCEEDILASEKWLELNTGK